MYGKEPTPVARCKGTRHIGPDRLSHDSEKDKNEIENPISHRVRNDAIGAAERTDEEFVGRRYEEQSDLNNEELYAERAKRTEVICPYVF